MSKMENISLDKCHLGKEHNFTHDNVDSKKCTNCGKVVYECVNGCDFEVEDGKVLHHESCYNHPDNWEKLSK